MSVTEKLAYVRQQFAARGYDVDTTAIETAVREMGEAVTIGQTVKTEE